MLEWTRGFVCKKDLRFFSRRSLGDIFFKGRHFHANLWENYRDPGALRISRRSDPSFVILAKFLHPTRGQNPKIWQSRKSVRTAIEANNGLSYREKKIPGRPGKFFRKNEQKFLAGWVT